MATNNSTTDTPNKYIPVIMDLSFRPGDKKQKNIFDFDADIKYSTNIEYPRSQYGFHHFIHANKNKTEILKQFENKKKVYLVMNRFERYVDNYEDSIGNVSKKYFDISSKDGEKPNILSRGFYKLWEILLLFGLIDVKNEKFVSAHLAEGPGSFIQATMFYRELFCAKGKYKNDKYHAVTLHPEDTGIDSNHVPDMEDKFIKYYAKENPVRFVLHKTYSKQVAGASKSKDNGDITDPKTIKLFGKSMSEKADFITGDGGFEWINENVQEQEAYRLILSQIISASKIQKKGGSFVCKFFETFTKTSLKIICILQQLYDKVYFIKPLMSRASNSEKYAVCIGFKYDVDSGSGKQIAKKLDDLLNGMHKSVANKDNKIVDIFTEYQLSTELIESMTHLNRTISNHQLKSINEIVSFVKKEIYSGDEYVERREQQIEGSKYWINLFFPEVSSYEKKIKSYESIVERATHKSKTDAQNLAGKIVQLTSQNDV